MKSVIIQTLQRVKENLAPNKKSLALMVILLLLIGILGVKVAFKPQLLNEQILYIQNAFQNISRSKPWIQSSQAYINIERENVQIKFKVASGDQSLIKQFSSNLGVSEEYLSGISFEVDENTKANLEQFLPINVNLDISPKRMGFFTPGIKGLESSLIKDKLEFATGSSKLDLKVRGDKEIELEIQDPEPMLKYATNSGQINLSDKLEPLFPIMEKIATIKLEINGNHLEGEIVLK